MNYNGEIKFSICIKNKRPNLKILFRGTKFNLCYKNRQKEKDKGKLEKKKTTITVKGDILNQ